MPTSLSKLDKNIRDVDTRIPARCSRSQCNVMAWVVLFIRRMRVRPVRDTLQIGRIWGISVLLFLALSIHAAENSPKITADLTDLSLEQLMDIPVPTVYGASKIEQKTTEAPSSVTVISSDEIKRYGYRTLGDVLQSLQGFYVSYDRNYSFIGARGINLGDFNSRILLLVNGHRVNNNLTDGAFIGTAFILDIDLIDRIEVVRGPGSVLYGNNAFFGVINVITRTGGQVNGAEVSGEYASYDTYKGRATYGKSFTNGLQMLFSMSFFDSEGKNRLFYKEFNTPDQNNGIAKQRDEDGFKSFFGSVSYKDFTIEGAYIDREKGNPTAQYSTAFNDSRLDTVDERAYVNLKYAHKFDFADVNAQVYYDRNNFEVGYPTDNGSGTTLYREEDSGQWWGAELQLTRKFWDKHVITVGTEIRDDFDQHRRISDADTGTIFNDTHHSQFNYGFYAQGDFEVLTNLHFSGGVRYDQYGDFDPSINPRLALIYNAWAKSTFKLIYGTAFRAPNFLELSNPDFQNISPEEITSYEIVYEQGIGRHLRSSISGYYNQMDNLILFESGTFRNFNVDAAGVELALEASWTNGIRARASYTYDTTTKHSSDLDLPDSPNHMFKLNISVPVYKDKIFAGLEYQYVSERESLHNTTDGFGQPLTVQGAKADDYGIINFTIFSQNLVKNLEFSASIYNLLDCKYSDPATRFHTQDTIEQNGRSFRLKLTYRF